ncbi:hypothetical protein IAU59_007609 [Kwoniella sp. CBS 9459]
MAHSTPHSASSNPRYGDLTNLIEHIDWVYATAFKRECSPTNTYDPASRFTSQVNVAFWQTTLAHYGHIALSEEQGRDYGIWRDGVPQDRLEQGLDEELGRDAESPISRGGASPLRHRETGSAEIDYANDPFSFGGLDVEDEGDDFGYIGPHEGSSTDDLGLGSLTFSATATQPEHNQVGPLPTFCVLQAHAGLLPPIGRSTYDRFFPGTHWSRVPTDTIGSRHNSRVRSLRIHGLKQV